MKVKILAATALTPVLMTLLGGCGSGRTQAASYVPSTASPSSLADTTTSIVSTTTSAPTTTAASTTTTLLSANPQVQAWCSIVVRSATEYQHGMEMSKLEQSDAAGYISGTGSASPNKVQSEYTQATTDLQAAIADTNNFEANPPASILTSFKTAESIPGDTVVVSQQQQLSSAESAITGFLSTVCNVDFPTSEWLGNPASTTLATDKNDNDNVQFQSTEAYLRYVESGG